MKKDKSPFYAEDKGRSHQRFSLNMPCSLATPAHSSNISYLLRSLLSREEDREMIRDRRTESEQRETERGTELEPTMTHGRDVYISLAQRTHAGVLRWLGSAW